MTTYDIVLGDGADRPSTTKKVPERIPYLETPLPATWKTVIDGAKEIIPCKVVRALNDGIVTIRLDTGAEFTATKAEVSYER